MLTGWDDVIQEGDVISGFRCRHETVAMWFSKRRAQIHMQIEFLSTEGWSVAWFYIIGCGSHIYLSFQRPAWEKRWLMGEYSWGACLSRNHFRGYGHCRSVCVEWVSAKCVQYIRVCVGVYVLCLRAYCSMDVKGVKVEKSSGNTSIQSLRIKLYEKISTSCQILRTQLKVSNIWESFTLSWCSEINADNKLSQYRADNSSHYPVNTTAQCFIWKSA